MFGLQDAPLLHSVLSLDVLQLRLICHQLFILQCLLLLLLACSKVWDMVFNWLGWQLLLLLLLWGQLITRAALDMLLGEETFQRPCDGKCEDAKTV